MAQSSARLSSYVTQCALPGDTVSSVENVPFWLSCLLILCCLETAAAVAFVVGVLHYQLVLLNTTDWLIMYEDGTEGDHTHTAQKRIRRTATVALAVAKSRHDWERKRERGQCTDWLTAAAATWLNNRGQQSEGDYITQDDNQSMSPGL